MAPKKIIVPNDIDPTLQNLETLIAKKGELLNEIDKLERPNRINDPVAKQRLPEARLRFLTVSLEIQLQQAKEEKVPEEEWQSGLKKAKELEKARKNESRNPNEFKQLIAEVIEVGNKAIDRNNQLKPQDLEGL